MVLPNRLKLPVKSHFHEVDEKVEEGEEEASTSSTTYERNNQQRQQQQQQLEEENANWQDQKATITQPDQFHHHF